MKKFKYTDTDLINIIKNKAAELGRTPIYTDLKQGKIISERFGTWNNALVEAGLKTNRSHNLFKIGTKIGMLTIIGHEKIDKRAYYKCKCDCGNKTFVRADSLKKNNFTKSCGCLSKNTQFKEVDIIGNRYGRLLIIGRSTKNKFTAKCDCGNIIEVTKKQIFGKQCGRKSCGCLSNEVNKGNIKLAQTKLKEVDLVEGTSISKIKREKPIKSNRSGFTGVSWDSARQKWVAQIWFKGKYYHLGRFEKKEDAIKARSYAKEVLHNNFLANREKQSKE